MALINPENLVFSRSGYCQGLIEHRFLILAAEDADEVIRPHEVACLRFVAETLLHDIRAARR